LRSTRSLFSGRTTERGYVLISVIALAILYFGLMELMLLDSSRTLREAQRFRARVVATTLAESAAELAAAQMVTQPGATVTADDDQGKMTASLNRNGNAFLIDAQGEALGSVDQKSSVKVQGEIRGTHVTVTYTYHAQ
jgi:hypothetical protein